MWQWPVFGGMIPLKCIMILIHSKSIMILATTHVVKKSNKMHLQ